MGEPLVSWRWRFVKDMSEATDCVFVKLGSLRLERKDRVKKVVLTSESSSSTVRRIPDPFSRPGFEVGRMQSAEIFDIVCIDTFYGLEPSFVLPDTSNRNSEASHKSTIGDQDICRVGLHADAVVPVVDEPVIEGNSRAVDCICTIGIIWVKGLEDRYSQIKDLNLRAGLSFSLVLFT